MAYQSTNSNSAPYVSNDGDVHKTKVGQLVDNMTPSSNNNNNNNNTNAGYGQTGQSTYGQTGQSGYGQSGQPGQYVASDGDHHHTAAGARLDNATPSSNNNNTYGSTGLGGHSSAAHNTTGAGYGSSHTSGLGQGQQEQYLSNSGETHKSKIGAKIDDMTPNSHNSNVHSNNTSSSTRHVANDGDVHRTAAGAQFDSATPSYNQHSNTGLTGSHAGTGLTGSSHTSNSGLTGSNSNNQYVSNDGDVHSSKLAAKIDSATPSSGQGQQGQYYGSGTNTTGTHTGGLTGSHSTGTQSGGLTGSHSTGTHTSPTAGTHNTSSTSGVSGITGEKPTMMEKIKGMTEEVVGKATKNPAKIEHGQALAGKNTNL